MNDYYRMTIWNYWHSHMLTPRLRKTAKTLKVMLFRLKSLQDQWWWSHSSANPTIKLQVVGSQPQNVNIIDSKASATELFGVLQQQLFLGRFPVHGSCQQRLWRSPCRAVVWCLNPHAVRDTSIYIYVCVYMTYEYMNNQQITKETNIYILYSNIYIHTYIHCTKTYRQSI